MRAQRALAARSALAHAYAGDDEAARALEQAADETRLEGFGVIIDAPRLNLALLRSELERAEELLHKPNPVYRQPWFYLSAASSRLDGLAAIGDRGRLEAEAPEFLRSRTYLEPFALRALGIVREDESSIEQAAERFAAMGLDWHKQQTRALMGR